MNFKSLMLTLVCLLSTNFIFAQGIAAPEVQAVYGGRISDISGYAMANSMSRIFITTESSNSAFYADVDMSSGTPAYGNFQVVPALSGASGWGGNVQRIGVEENSGAVVFLSNGLHYLDPTYTNVTSPYFGNVQDFIIVDSKIFFTTGSELHFGTFDVSGNYSEDSGSPISVTGAGNHVTMCLNPIDNHLYFFYGTNGNFLQIYKTTHDYNSISGATGFAVKPVSLTTSADWTSMGIGPDGRIFFGGHTGGHKQIAYSDDESTWIETTTMGGNSGNRFAFGGDASQYSVYWASTYSDNKGDSETWHSFGSTSFETHPNDGAVFADPHNDDVVYMTTDQGIGSSDNKGETIFEINDGVEAVQVKDMDMEGSKNVAWFASKSGIRKVADYQSTPIWSNAIFPNGDGSPYFSAEMNMSNHDEVYVGNARVYKTSNDGTTWAQVFSAEHPPYNFPNVGSEIRTIEISNDDPNIVMAGYVLQNGGHGGLFVTEDAGVNWDQILIDATTVGQDVNINDIELTMENGSIVAYVGVEYETGFGKSVYRIEQASGTWNVAEDMLAANTTNGTQIVVSINDVDLSVTRDTVFATGTDAGTNHPVAYYKPLDASGLWTPFTTTGFPNDPGKRGYAITIGHDTVYCAVDHEIYYMPLGESSWKVGYSYPIGTQINFLYFDDLLAGTGTGLYEHPSDGTPVSTSVKPLLQEVEEKSWMKINPNPMITSAQIQFTLPQRGNVEISLHDFFGKKVKTLEKGFRLAGEHNSSVDVSNLPNGTYYCILKFGDHLEMMQVVKVE